MALTGLDIFKLLPKSNCKKCGLPTCLAFAMQLAQKKVKLDDCPCASDEAKQSLAAAAEPPMIGVSFGDSDHEINVGKETVLFRHEEKFHNPAELAVTVSDNLTGDELAKQVKEIDSLKFERVGTHLAVKCIAVVNDSNSPETFAQVCGKIAESTKFALILISDKAESLAAAANKVSQKKPLLAWAKNDTAEEIAKVAKEHNCPLVVRAASIEELANLTDKIKGLGVNDMVLSLDGISLQEQFYNITRIRTLALKKVFRPLGYPILSFITDGKAENQAALATSMVCKYSNIVVLSAAKAYSILPVLTTVMNVYSDPQKPVQVEPRFYTIGEADENSPVLFTTNFSLTYYTVESDVEASRVPSHILVVDTEGTSVLTAYSGDKLNEKTVADAITKYEVEKLIKHKKLIIPGYVAVMSGKLEEATGWEIMVGPRESSMLPKYLQEVWKQAKFP